MQMKLKHINGLVQDCSNSIANALELLQSCTKPSIYRLYHSPVHTHHPKKSTHGLCFVVFCCGKVLVYFTHIVQVCYTCIGAIIWLPQCQWSIPEQYGKISDTNLLRSNDITTTKQSTTNQSIIDLHAYVMEYCISEAWSITWDITCFQEVGTWINVMADDSLDMLQVMWTWDKAWDYC